MGGVEGEARPGFTFDAFAARKANEFIARQTVLGTSGDGGEGGGGHGHTSMGFSIASMFSFGAGTQNAAEKHSGGVASSTSSLPPDAGGHECHASPAGLGAVEFAAVCA